MQYQLFPIYAKAKYFICYGSFINDVSYHGTSIHNLSHPYKCSFKHCTSLSCINKDGYSRAKIHDERSYKCS